MRPKAEVSIIGYGGYVPRHRIKLGELAGVKPGDEERSIALDDEDVVTMSIEAGTHCLHRSGIRADQLGAVYLGSCTRVYGIKPSATILTEALGATPKVLAADIEFGGKSGTEAFQACIGLVGSGMMSYALTAASDSFCGKSHGEINGGSAAAVFVFGPRGADSIAHVEGSTSFVTDTPDMWRRAGAYEFKKEDRFAAEPAYYRHVAGAVESLMSELSLKAGDFDYAVFQQPNQEFPSRIAKRLGFSPERIEKGMLVSQTGDTGSASALLGLAAVLDEAVSGQRILLASYGSGAGSDAISLIVDEGCQRSRGKGLSVKELLSKKEYITYQEYLRLGERRTS